MKRAIGAGVLAAVLAATATGAHQGATGIVKERMDAMSEVADAAKLIGLMLRDPATLDADKAGAAARSIAAHGGQSMLDRYPEGSGGGVSEARDTIWSDWDGFSDGAFALEKTATALAEAFEGEGEGQGDTTAAFRAMGQTCSACHETYRIKK